MDMVSRLYTYDYNYRWAIEAAIAFTDPRQDTMMAICGPDPSNCSSFAHELFHLLNSSAYEGAPWWLYEGIAALHESGDLDSRTFSPRVSWRKTITSSIRFRSSGLKTFLDSSVMRSLSLA